IDGPAALLGSEAPDLGSKIQVLSVSPPQQPSPPTAEEPETDADTDTLLEPKTDIHTLLQRRGKTHTHPDAGERWLIIHL
ncbi:hypothetical protein M9458_010109, partial [Cirrhinus mrigala]